MTDYEQLRADVERRLCDLYAGQQNAAQSAHPLDDSYATYRDHLLGKQRNLTDHAEASAVMLENYAARIRGGTSPEDLGKDVELLGRIMARRT